MPYDTHLKQAPNICWFHGPLVTSQNLTSYLNLFLRYSNLKNPAFWLSLKFLDHNSRNRLFPSMLSFQKVKNHWHFHDEAKNINIWLDKIFAKTLKTSFLWLFEPTESMNFFSKTGPVTFLLYDVLLHGKISEKNWWFRDLLLQTDKKIDKFKFIGHFC